MIVRDPVAMKCAFGENPKRCYRDKCDSTRMSTAAFLRGALMQARDYGARKQAANGDVTKMPAYNQKLEALLPVLAREIPLKAHAHQANDIFTALRIAREFDLRLTLEHVTEGHLIADELAKEKDVPMAVGPSLTFASKFELQNKSWKTPGVLANAGCHVSIITDNSVIPQQYLPLCAGMAVKAGMDPFDALKALPSTRRSTSAWPTASARWRWARTPTSSSRTAAPSSHDRGAGRIYRRRAGCGITPLAK